MTVGLGIAPNYSRFVITAPGWNVGGSTWDDLRPEMSRFIGAVKRAKRLRRIMKKRLGGGGGFLPILDIEDLEEAVLRITEALDQRITEDSVERETEGV